MNYERKLLPFENGVDRAYVARLLKFEITKRRMFPGWPGASYEGLVGCMAGGIQSAREQWRTSSNETEALSGNNRAELSHRMAQ